MQAGQGNPDLFMNLHFAPDISGFRVPYPRVNLRLASDHAWKKLTRSIPGTSPATTRRRKGSNHLNAPDRDLLRPE